MGNGRGWLLRCEGRGQGIAVCWWGSQDYRNFRLLQSWICGLLDPSMYLDELFEARWSNLVSISSFPRHAEQPGKARGRQGATQGHAASQNRPECGAGPCLATWQPPIHETQCVPGQLGQCQKRRTWRSGWGSRAQQTSRR